MIIEQHTAAAPAVAASAPRPAWSAARQVGWAGAPGRRCCYRCCCQCMLFYAYIYTYIYIV